MEAKGGQETPVAHLGDGEEPGLDPDPLSAAFQHILPVRPGLLALMMAPGTHCGQGLCENLVTFRLLLFAALCLVESSKQV